MPQQVDLFADAPTAAVRGVCRSDDVDRLLRKGNAVAAMSISGGKDGCAAALAVGRYLNQLGFDGPRVLVHSNLGLIEWKDSLPSCERLAAHTGMELIVVRQSSGDLLNRWQRRWEANVQRYAAMRTTRIVLPWSTPRLRFCTSEQKTGPICSALKRRFPTRDIVNIVGIRAQESTARSRQPVARVNPSLTRRGLTGITWNAILDWPVEAVWDEIRASGMRPHEAYTKYGSTRVSCTFCIMSSAHDLRAASVCEDNHDVYRALVELEVRSTFAFQGSRWLGDVAPHLLPSGLVARLANAKAAAQSRQQAEACIPDTLLLKDGIPKRVPTIEEAEAVATARRTVARALGIEVAFVDADSVRRVYAERIEQRMSTTSAVNGLPEAFSNCPSGDGG